MTYGKLWPEWILFFHKIFLQEFINHLWNECTWIHKCIFIVFHFIWYIHQLSYLMITDDIILYFPVWYTISGTLCSRHDLYICCKWWVGPERRLLGNPAVTLATCHAEGKPWSLTYRIHAKLSHISQLPSKYHYRLSNHFSCRIEEFGIWISAENRHGQPLIWGEEESAGKKEHTVC